MQGGESLCVGQVTLNALAVSGSQNMSPAGHVRDGALVIDDVPSIAGLMRRSSGIRARMPPSHEDCHFVMFAARRSMAKVLQRTTRAVTPLQREVRNDFQVASSLLPSLLILATTILTTIGAVRVLASALPLTGI